MTPAEFRACRDACGLTQAQWAVALGYASTDRKHLGQQMSDIEGGRKHPSIAVERLAIMLGRYGVPPEFLARR